MAIVLVVNDDHDMLDAYRALLTELGHEVVTEVIVESGPRAVRDAQADAILVDLQQPHQDDYGLRLIEEVRADPVVKAIPIILNRSRRRSPCHASGPGTGSRSPCCASPSG